MRERITDTLLEMIAIDSDNRADKRPIVAHATGWLEDLGMEVTITGPEETPAILARSGKGGLVLSGHLDTVPLGEGWSVPQCHVEGGRIYGRGASDMKGAVASTLEAACTLSNEGVPFAVMLTTDEEEGMMGALSLTELGALEDSRGVIIGEPTGMKVASMEKGVLRLRLTSYGRAGHSSQPWMGENAIMRMHASLSSLGELIDTPKSPTEGLTATVTTINGGTKNNVIPESCTAEIDIRFPPSQTLDGVKGLLASKLDGMPCRVETTAELDPFLAPEGSALVREALDHLGTEIFPAMFATEAARFQSHNQEIIICGPGMPGTCHIADEWVEIANLERFHDFLLHMARYAIHG